MNELTGALRVVNTAFRTVRIIDIIKKIVIATAAVICCVFAFRIAKMKG